ncbi:hypothetical protein PR048_012181 [Dryococelus australis]|uniref:Uncharacterized protein n=1 Tax=Dryococelus australis TaxID=614101 RepID=A0ABQ9HNM6_9NEOP|nr:hypothetical protein PR048_012181 [Dryococelus australis]
MKQYKKNYIYCGLTISIKLKYFRTSNYAKREELLKSWLIEAPDGLGIQDSAASNGYITRLKERNNICNAKHERESSIGEHCHGSKHSKLWLTVMLVTKTCGRENYHL